MIQNIALILPAVYIVLYLIGVFINYQYDLCLKDTSIGMFLSIIFAACLLIFIIILFVGFIGQINDEEITYAQRQTEYKTIVNILETSNDVVNSDIYLKAFEYNSLITQTQKAIHDPAYSIMAHFLKCDWDSLPLIEFN